MRSRSPRLALALLPAFLLGGCISFAPKPPAILLTLTPASPLAPGTTIVASDATAVQVTVPATPQMLAPTRIPVRSAAGLSYLKDAVWADAPARLFRNLLAETVTARTGRFVPNLRQQGIAPETRIAGTLANFGLDAVAGQAVVTFDATLVRAGRQQVETRRFEVRTPTADETPATVAAALDASANGVATQVADWIGR